MVEFAKQILPQYDQEITKVVEASLKSLGVEILTGGAKAKHLIDDGASVLVETADGGAEITLPFDKVLVTVGRKARLEGWGGHPTSI